MKKENKTDLIDLLKAFAKKDQAIQELFGEAYLDHEISMLWGMIEEQFDIKKGNDEAGENLSAFECGEISKNELIRRLTKTKNR